MDPACVARGNVRKIEPRCLQSPLRDQVMYGARECRQVSVRPSIALLPTRNHVLQYVIVARRSETLVDRAPVRIGSPTTPIIKESMSEPRESHDLTHCCRNDLLVPPLPLPAFRAEVC